MAAARDLGSIPSAEQRLQLQAKARAILRGRAVQRVVKDAKALAFTEVAPRSGRPPPVKKRTRLQRQGAVFPSWHAHEPLVSDDGQTPDEFIEQAAGVGSPLHAEGAALSHQLRAAIWRLAEAAANGEDVSKARDFTLKAVKRLASKLAQAEQALRIVMPPHIAGMVRPIKVALLYVLAAAAGAPSAEDLALSLVTGFEAVGDIPPSGWWEMEDVEAAEFDIDDLDHEAWHDELEQAIRTSAHSISSQPEHMGLFAKTMEEVDAGLVHGPFSRDQIVEQVGLGGARGMQRFAVLQGGKIRACDNAKKSLHNRSTTVFEKLTNIVADWPAAVAKEFQAAFAAGGLPPPANLAGTDDWSDAYRHLPCAHPQFTIFALWDPVHEKVVWFSLPGFNFGLKSAVNQFNRLAETVVCINQVFFAAACDHYFDDFILQEPVSTAANGQKCLRELSALLGMPFAPKKAVDVGNRVIFLGVESDLSESAAGHVSLRVRPDRVQRLQATLEEVLDARELPSGAAASIVGRLSFTLSWVFGRVGRAAMQPLHAAAGAQSGRFDAGTAASIRFFVDTLPSIPPQVVHLWEQGRRPTLVWTDGASEGDQHWVGWLVASPKEGVPDDLPIADRYDFVHGSAQLTQEIITLLFQRKQQIGQVEIIGAIVPYLSVPELLAGRDVLHWIDNTSAQAALTKGYSGVPDSARLVHIFHAWNCGARARVWFEYIPSKSNPADEPSRSDLSQSLYAIGESIVSQPRPTKLPEPRRWSDPAGWLEEAADLARMLGAR